MTIDGHSQSITLIIIMKPPQHPPLMLSIRRQLSNAQKARVLSLAKKRMTTKEIVSVLAGDGVTITPKTINNLISSARNERLGSEWLYTRYLMT